MYFARNKQTKVTSIEQSAIDISIAHDVSALIWRAQQGDSEAFSALYRLQRPRIFQISRSYYAPGADRDDLVQEATIGFFKAVRDFKGDRGAFGSFVDLCVRRQIITFIKGITRRKHAALNYAVSLDAPTLIDSTEPLVSRLGSNDPTFFETDAVAFLNELCARCSPLEQGIVSMYAAGYSFEEMASELGVHLKAIDNGVWRVKVKAKKLLAERPMDLLQFGIHSAR